MIEKEIKETIASSTVPVLLGNGTASIAWRLYRTVGTVSLRIGTKRRWSDLFGFASVFRPAANNSRLLCEQLSDIFEEFDGYLLLLVPTDKPSRDFVAAHRDFLSARFILSEPNEVLEHIPCWKESYQ